MQRITELCTKQRLFRKTKISRLILEAMDITQEEVITVKEDTTIKVDIRIILQEGQDARYATKKIILVQIVLTRRELT